MNAVDTNILLYAHDPRDPVKQVTARSLIEELSDGVLIWQVACEYLSASRKLIPLGFSFEDACRELDRLRDAWAVYLPATWALLEDAVALKAQALSFWDALIIAACRRAGVRKLYSEDLGGRREIAGVTLINPFVPGA